MLHSVRHDSVNSDGGEQRSYEREQPEQHRVIPGILDLLGKLILHGGRIAKRTIRIDLRNSAPQRGQQAHRIALRSEDKRELEALERHRSDAVRPGLEEGNVDRRLLRPLLWITWRIVNHGDDLARLVLRRKVDLHVFPERIFVRPEPARYRFIDNRHPRRIACIAHGEVAAA